MHLSEKLRARISALGELSRPLGEVRATALARKLAASVARDVAAGRDTRPTIDTWIREIALEIASTSQRAPSERMKAKPAGPTRHRSIADILPEVR